mmetsp:Transcript_33501/g.76533  ORF Transcript_33501/g.76533 Transcript_33501/m.76533 type:complete len:310 (+) Transcript_33501:110-1039(+)
MRMPLTLRALALARLSLIAAASPLDVCVWANGLGQSASSWLQIDKVVPAMHTIVMTDFAANRSEPLGPSIATIEMLHSWGDENLRDRSVKSLAIVGNGPLSDSDREEIKTFPEERLIRFNSMANLKLDEAVGHLYANACASGWWGVTALPCKRMRSAKEVVLFGEPEKAKGRLTDFNERYGDHVILGIPDGEHISIDGKSYVTHNVNGGFSIGFKGIAYARWRYPEAKLQIYGFSWKAPPKNRGHPFGTEKDGVYSMKNVEVHPTPPSESWHGEPFACEMERVQALLQEGSGSNMTEAWSLWAGEAFEE